MLTSDFLLALRAKGVDPGVLFEAAVDVLRELETIQSLTKEARAVFDHERALARKRREALWRTEEGLVRRRMQDRARKARRTPEQVDAHNARRRARRQERKLERQGTRHETE